MARHDLDSSVPIELQTDLPRGRKKKSKSRTKYEIYLDKLEKEQRTRLSKSRRYARKGKLLGPYDKSPAKQLFEQFFIPLLQHYAASGFEDRKAIMEALFGADDRPSLTFIVDQDCFIRGKIRGMATQKINRKAIQGNCIILIESVDRLGRIVVSLEHIYDGYDHLDPVVFHLNSEEYKELLPSLRQIL